jgi:type II secretory pathway predicted ATPase ExeA
MYEAFYGFKDKPFSMLPDPGFLYLSKKHQMALTLLEYGLLNHVGFCVISGEPGAGKTTILRTLLGRVGDDVTVGLITNTHQSFGGLLDWVLSAFDLHRPNLTHVEMHQVFMEFLIDEYANGKTVLLIVDEAQNMKADTLEELRMLSNVNSEKDQLMQIVLAGQPALKDTLKLPDLMQFAQRVAVDYHLDPLSLEETCGYIQHRLVTAGSQKDVFTPAACERIYNYSGGTPRLINLLCETVLVYGFADQREMIDVDLVDEMVLERMKDSVVPIVNRDIASQDNSEASKELEKNFPWIRPQGDSAGSNAEADTLTQITEPDETQQVIKQHVDADTVGAVEVENEKTAPDSVAETGHHVTAAAKDQHQVQENEKKPQVKSSPLAAVEKTVPSHEKKTVANNEGDSKAARKQLIKYAVIAAIIGVVMIVFAITLGDDQPVATDVTGDDAGEAALKLQREQEEKKYRQLQIEAETLKRERDAAIAKAEAEAEKRATEEAEKQAAAAAALAAKAAAEKTRAQELKRVEQAKRREREARLAEAKAKEAAERARLEAAKLEEQQRIMQIRLEEEKRLKELQEARRLELERLEAQRLQQLAAEEQAKLAAAEEAAANNAVEAKAKSVECSGPAAKFKSGCR